MKKIFPILVIIMLLVSCTSVKNTEEAMPKAEEVPQVLSASVEESEDTGIVSSEAVSNDLVEEVASSAPEKESLPIQPEAVEETVAIEIIPTETEKNIEVIAEEKEPVVEVKQEVASVPNKPSFLINLDEKNTITVNYLEDGVLDILYPTVITEENINNFVKDVLYFYNTEYRLSEVTYKSVSPGHLNLFYPKGSLDYETGVNIASTLQQILPGWFKEIENKSNVSTVEIVPVENNEIESKPVDTNQEIIVQDNLISTIEEPVKQETIDISEESVKKDEIDISEESVKKDEIDISEESVKKDEIDISEKEPKKVEDNVQIKPETEPEIVVSTTELVDQTAPQQNEKIVEEVQEKNTVVEKTNEIDILEEEPKKVEDNVQIEPETEPEIVVSTIELVDQTAPQQNEKIVEEVQEKNTVVEKTNEIENQEQLEQPEVYKVPENKNIKPLYNFINWIKNNILMSFIIVGLIILIIFIIKAITRLIISNKRKRRRKRDHENQQKDLILDDIINFDEKKDNNDK